MYSFPNLQPVHCSMSGSNCCFLTCIHISQEAGKVAWYSHLFQNFPQIIVIHTVKGFSVVNEAEVYVFLEFSCFFYDSTDIGNLISGSSASSKSSLNIWRFSVYVLLKPSLENFEHYFSSMWNECNCAVVWTLPFGIALLRDWNENWPFPVLWPLLSFPNLLAYWACYCCQVASVVSDSVWPQRRQPTRLPCPILSLEIGYIGFVWTPAGKKAGNKENKRMTLLELGGEKG